MLIINISDTHLTGKNPICRKDNLVTVQFSKWEEIIDLANSYAAPIIHTGDIFNTPLIANSLLAKLGDVLEKLNNPLYFIWGNHDLQYHSIDMWDRTSLGVLWANNSKVKHISEFEKDYNIKIDYCDWDQPIVKTGGDILVIHKAIIPEKAVGKNTWMAKDTIFCDVIDYSSLLQKYKLIMCGHWHKQYIHKFKNTTIINSGPVCRQTVDEIDDPSITSIDLYNINNIDIIKLLTAKPAEEVISRKHLKDDINDSNENSEIINLIQQFKIKPETKQQTSKFINKLEQMLDSHLLSPILEQMIKEIMLVALNKNK